MKFIKIALILSAIALFVFACAENQNVNTNTAVGMNSNGNATVANANTISNAINNSQPVVGDETASGRKIYNQICANCHKEDGTGGKVVIDGTTLNAENLTSEHAKKDPDAEFIEVIKNGIKDEGMPAFGDRLSDEEIRNVVKFIRTEIQGKQM